MGAGRRYAMLCWCIAAVGRQHGLAAPTQHTALVRQQLCFLLCICWHCLCNLCVLQSFKHLLAWSNEGQLLRSHDCAEGAILLALIACAAGLSHAPQQRHLRCHQLHASSSSSSSSSSSQAL
jgi:hypothetical protein